MINDLASTLARNLPADDGHLDQLARRLVDLADSRGVLDVGYRTVHTPVGHLLIAATATGVVRVAYLSDGPEAVLQQLSDTVSPRLLHAPARLDQAATQLDEYFGGSRQDFDLPLDWRLAGDFGRTVLAHLRDQLRFGHTASYGTIARNLGRPTASRAVGRACATNPLPVIVPCHRVILSNGTPGEYVGGAAAKVTLLDLEAA